MSEHAAVSSLVSPEGNLTALYVIKRDGQLVPYTDSKIAIAITKAILAVEGQSASGSSRVKETVDALVADISARFHKLQPNGGNVHIEEIQDQVELGLMRQGLQKVARAYVIYREEHAKQRVEEVATQEHPNLKMTNNDGSHSPLNVGRIRTVIEESCANLADVDAERLLSQAMTNLYDGIKRKDVATALIMAARPLIESEPNYSYVSARLLLDSLREEALSYLKVAPQATYAEMQALYPQALKAALETGIKHELLSEELLTFDLELLGAAIKPERDLQFTYLGLQTLYDRYFLHWRETRIE